MLSFETMNNKKFRVWNYLDKRFIYPDKGYQGHYILTLGGKFLNLQTGEGERSHKVHQFIGILDKNMKEIYEGDVVKYSMDYGKMEPIEKIGEVFYNLASYVIDRDGFHKFDDENLVFDSVEVIGNMQEHFMYDENGDLVKQ